MAETLAQGINDSLVFIPKAARDNQYDYTLAEGERLGFVFPIYSWAPPQLVLNFVKQLRFATKPEYVFFVCTCGDQCGQTERIFRGAVQEKGWELAACFSLIMPETYIGMAGFKLDTEEKAKQKIAEANFTLTRNIPRLMNKERFFAETAVCFCGTFHRRRYRSAVPALTAGRPALWSPDFPPPPHSRGAGATSSVQATYSNILP